MILRTKIAWYKAKEESEEEKLKREVLGDDYYEEKPSKEDYDTTKKDVIVDTIGEKIYIQLHDDQVCIQRLLQTELLTTESGAVTRYEDSIIIYSNLDEIYEELKKEKQY